MIIVLLQKHRELLMQIVRYVIGGGLAALIDLSILYLCVEYLGVQYLFAQILAFCVSVMFWFIFQKYITFSDSSFNVLWQWVSFIWLQCIWLGINVFILYFCVEYWGVHYLLWSIIAKSIVLIWNFVMNYRFTFTRK